jgi:hypothetical protein
MIIRSNPYYPYTYKKSQKNEQTQTLPVMQERTACSLPNYKAIGSMMPKISFKGQSTSRNLQEEMLTYGNRVPIGDKLLNGFEYKDGYGEIIVVDYKNDKTLNKVIDEFENELKNKEFSNNLEKIYFMADFVNGKFDKNLSANSELTTNYKYNTPEQMAELNKKNADNPEKLHEELIKSKERFESSPDFKGYLDPEIKNQLAKWTVGDILNQRQGVCRHKFLLVKILCDKVLSKPPHNIESSLECGYLKTPDSGHAWNTIKYDNKFLVLDVEQASMIPINDGHKDLLDSYKRPLREVGEQTNATATKSDDKFQSIYT